MVIQQLTYCYIAKFQNFKILFEIQLDFLEGMHIALIAYQSFKQRSYTICLHSKHMLGATIGYYHIQF